jgi:hypothetical protein
MFWGEVPPFCVKIFVLIFILFFGKNDWIFNNSHTKILRNMKSHMWILTHKGFSNNTNCAMGKMTWFGGFQDDKQPFLMHRFLYCPLFHFIFMCLLVMVLNFCGSMLFIFCRPTKGLTIHKNNEPNSTYTWIWKWKHLSILLLMALNYWILGKKTWWFGISFPYNLANLSPFLFVRIPLFRSKCHFLSFKIGKKLTAIKTL